MSTGRLRRTVSRFRNTLAGALIGAVALIWAFFLDKDLFDYLVGALKTLERLKADELFIAGVSVLVGLVVDLSLIRRAEERTIELQEQRLRVLRATMRTVQDIVNNFLNSLLFFRLEAEERGALSETSLQSMDALIQETTAKLTALGDLEETPEKPLVDDLMGIDYRRE